MGRRNAQIPEYWSAGKSARSDNGHFSTDGANIYSYRLLIGKTVDGRKILFDYRGQVSGTTSMHVGLAKGHANEVKAPPRNPTYRFGST
jgi:hypothetical protein